MESYDYVIVGGGTAGCILANRLSADRDVTLLMLEAGGSGKGIWTTIPAGFSRLLTNDVYNYRFETEPEVNVNGRRIVVPRGKGLGGSSLINGMIFVRGQPADYDHWAQRGNAGWGFEDVLPYFRKLENYAGGGELRGQAGPMSIVKVKEHTLLAEAFIAAGEQAGYVRNPDYNSERQDGFGYYQVNQSNGRRCSAAVAYLEPIRHRANLTVRTGAVVDRIEMDGRRATGVTYRARSGRHRVAARREVILAAGAVQSPHLLELSGIGDPAVLRAAGIDVRHPLVGVGANYIDHFCTRMSWRVQGVKTLNEQTRGWRLGLALAEYFVRRTGILTLGTGLAHGFVRTRPGLSGPLRGAGPLQGAGPDVQFFFMHASYADAGKRILDVLPGVTIGVAPLQSQSTGTIHARTSNCADAPAIRPNFLSAAEDRRSIIEGMKIAREIMRQPAMARYVVSEMNPGEGAVRTDEQWLEFARDNGQTIYHAIGTCAMGHDALAVVNARLRVHGLEGLRVIDASIMPTMVSGNTAAAVMMIAEKGADLIREDWRG